MSLDSKKANNNLGSLTQKAYKIIKDKIVTGEIKHGEVISLSAMAKKLNISRTPITYACQKLESDKFLTIIPKQGVIINSITINEAREIYELRAVIETYSAKRAFPNITEKDINYLENSYIKQLYNVEQNDIKLFMSEDINFHKYLLLKYENSHFFSIIDNLFDRAFLLGIESFKNSLRIKETLNEHRQIINCLINNDKNGFVDAVEKNILNGYIGLTGNYKF
jgi:DNA-binding GntR family transcriptional regulator